MSRKTKIKMFIAKNQPFGANWWGDISHVLLEQLHINSSKISLCRYCYVPSQFYEGFAESHQVKLVLTSLYHVALTVDFWQGRLFSYFSFWICWTNPIISQIWIILASHLSSLLWDVLAKDANGPVLNYWNQYAFKIIWSDIWIIDLNLNSWLQAWGVQNPKKLQLR